MISKEQFWCHQTIFCESKKAHTVLWTKLCKNGKYRRVFYKKFKQNIGVSHISNNLKHCIHCQNSKANLSYAAERVLTHLKNNYRKAYKFLTVIFYWLFKFDTLTIVKDQDMAIIIYCKFCIWIRWAKKLTVLDLKLKERTMASLGQATLSPSTCRQLTLLLPEINTSTLQWELDSCFSILLLFSIQARVLTSAIRCSKQPEPNCPQSFLTFCKKFKSKNVMSSIFLTIKNTILLLWVKPYIGFQSKNHWKRWKPSWSLKESF